MKILDVYFRRPLLWDYAIALLMLIVSIALWQRCVLELSQQERSVTITSDLSNISLTLAGFILTLLTVLITFKSGSKLTKESIKEDDTVFEIFFASDLYFETVKHLKNCVKSLILISIFGYSLKIGLKESALKYIYFYNIFGFIIIIMTLIRSLLILSKIIQLQKNEE